MTGNMVGRVFNNRYKILDRIGIGGMAEVYRAQDDVLGRIVAVKTMLPQYAADPNFTQRFRHEAAAAANLSSPYIVNVYDWGQDEGTYYIVMEYIRGSDLKTAIIERGAINQRKVAEIGAQVCSALSAAHNLDIVHRDIKPQNIMVQPDGNVKVMDFGIARAKNSVKTQTSSVLGTAHYISPEQAQGKELTAATDIYSLGIVLYEAATGALPFDGPDAVSVAMKQVNEPPVMPHEINPDIDPALEGIIMKALAKNPLDRFATATDMKMALNDYLAGRPVKLGSTFTGAETAVLGGMAGAGMAGAAVANGTAVMPAAVKPVATGTSTTSYRAGNGDNGKKSNKKTIAIVVGIIAALAIIGGVVFALSQQPSADAVDVPDVTNLTVDEAKTKLEDAGFELGSTDEKYDDKVEAGKIVSQDPKAGDKKDKGTKVNVIVSKGAEQVTVPDLTNMTSDEARDALDKVGLKGEQGTAEYSKDVEVNHVIKQSPAGGETVAKGSTVTYILSLGTENVSIPNVVNYSQDEAISTLQAAGFEAVVENGGYSDKVPQGYVMSQNPSSGAKLDKGGTVTIYISQGPEPTPQVTVDNVVGMTYDTAKRDLENQGFKVNISGSTDAGATVTSQDPAGGSTIDQGSTITIYTQAPEPVDSGNKAS